jgi:hypothetical protein
LLFGSTTAFVDVRKTSLIQVGGEPALALVAP